ncbi:MAG TPA: DMT family transporter, partial [Burkholderiaceae bacterium]|nr:DMT family transporter [Burkholderiaceae bacterium]
MQGRINGELGDVADDGILAAVVNFSVGLVALCLIVFSRKGGRQAFASIPAHLRSGTLPWWALLGGLGGASFVAAQGLTVPALGVALFTVATVAGQTGMSLAVDKWGLGPSGALPVSALRIVAAVLATVAVFVASSGRDGDGDDNARALVILALLAGAAVAFQAAFNGRLSVATGRPTVAALVNFTVGLVVLLVVWVIQRNARGSIEGSLPSF